MSAIEASAPLRLLRPGFATDDWVAVFLKSDATGRNLPACPVNRARLAPGVPGKATVP
jgi:hypothetical protein